jgi:excisionase family DNA binding protein
MSTTEVIPKTKLPHTQPARLAYSIREACAATSLGRTTVYALIGKGMLRTVRVGGRTLIPAQALEALVTGGEADGR